MTWAGYWPQAWRQSKAVRGVGWKVTKRGGKGLCVSIAGAAEGAVKCRPLVAAGGRGSDYRHDETFLGAIDSRRSADFALILAGVGLDAFSVFPAGETEARIVAILVRSGECFFDAFEGDGWVNLSSGHGSPP